MGYIPPDAEWYVAELVMEITVSRAQSNVVHRNLFLLRAGCPDEAYKKALQIGRSGQTEYKNPKGQIVKIRFRGVSKLDVIYEPLADGAELCFEELVGVLERKIQQMIPPKLKLEAFTAPKPGRTHDPDYRAGYVMKRAVKNLKGPVQ